MIELFKSIVCPSAAHTPAPFQVEGVERMAKDGNYLLADEMGLGKTAQAIMLCSLMGYRKILIVCKACLKLNWAREILAWCGGDNCITIIDAFHLTPMDERPVFYITNYERVDKYLDDMKAKDWDCVILDECHMVKNPNAKRTAATLSLRGKKKIALSGTPLENRPIELWPILSWLGINRALSYDAFGRQYCGGYLRKQFYKDRSGKARSRFIKDYSGASNLDGLRALMGSRTVRRLKKDVLTQLPPKTRTIIPIIADGAPSLVPAGATNLTQEEAVALLIGQSAGFTEMAEQRHEVGLAKLKDAIDFIEAKLEETDKVVVFAHHRDVIDGIVQHFEEEDIGVVKLVGGMSAKDAQASVDAFQNSPSVRVFVGNIIAAGAGITLTAASCVIFAELSWVPGQMSQAEDRCHRIGQNSNVQSYFIVADNTLEPAILQAIQEKEKIFNLVLDKQ